MKGPLIYQKAVRGLEGVVAILAVGGGEGSRESLNGQMVHLVLESNEGQDCLVGKFP